MKLKCKHILLSHKDAENSSHDRPLGEAMSEAERIIKGLKSGEMKFEETAGMYSACASGPRHGGDLGWIEEQSNTIGPPVITPWGVHIVLRTG